MRRRADYSTRKYLAQANEPMKAELRGRDGWDDVLPMDEAVGCATKLVS